MLYGIRLHGVFTRLQCISVLL